jgi:WD40 repeat protein
MLSEKTNAHSNWILSVAFSPDGTKIVSGSDDGTIKIWDSGAPRAQYRPSLLGQNWRLLACLAGVLGLLSEKTNAHSCETMSVAFSSDGTKIVSGSYDGTIKVWDSGSPASPEIALPWPKLTPVLACLAGNLKLMSKRDAHSCETMSVAFSSDGTKIVSGSADGTIKVWDSGAPRTQNRPSLLGQN